MEISAKGIPEEYQQAWRAREEGNPILAISLWEPFLAQYQAEGKWEKVINTWVDIAIAWKGLGSQTGEATYHQTALKILNNIHSLSNLQGVPLRNDWQLLVGKTEIDAGQYQQAIPRLESYLQSAELTPEQRADVNCHLGFAKAKLGQEEGVGQIRANLELLNKPTQEMVYQEKDLVVIWRTGALLRLAQVVKDQNEAKSLAQQALEEAQKLGLGTRVKEAERVLANL